MALTGFRLIRLAVILAALWLTACATPVYTRPGLTPEAWRRDRYECRRDAAMLPRNMAPDPTMGWADVLASATMFRECLEARGYARQ